MCCRREEAGSNKRSIQLYKMSILFTSNGGILPASSFSPVLSCTSVRIKGKGYDYSSYSEQYALLY